ncbi:MAG: hypothetical protein IIW40_05395, partial [Clostridia bacterium]|nr:hypothetical protein [Clostridia bacterium]
MLGRTNVGGMGLNFKVVGGTVQPENPRENMLWINTDVDIESWTFAAENPYIRNEDFYDKGEVKAGYYLKSTGVETAASNYEICTVELPSTATSFTVTAGSTSTTTVCHVFYDAAGELLSSVMRQTGRNTFDIPSGAASVRVSLRDEDTKAVEITYEDGSTEGEVWIATGSGASVPFNAIKKNALMVYPIKAYQYINGARVAKTAKTYKGGEWCDWALYIYKDGKLSEITGFTMTGGTATDADGVLTFTSSSTSTIKLVARSTEKIDFTGYETLAVNFVTGSKVYRGVNLTGAGVGFGITAEVPSVTTKAFSTGEQPIVSNAA